MPRPKHKLNLKKKKSKRCRSEKTNGLNDNSETIRILSHNENCGHNQNCGHNDQDDVIKKCDTQKVDGFDVLYGHHETQVSEGGEVNLQNHFLACEKNPGHTNFIPLETFNIYSLPESHRDDDLLQLIKVLADLTVRVSVKMTSPHRPEFWPKTNTPYFLYNMRGSTELKTGSGKVSSVMKFSGGQCPCEKCQHSSSPSKVWWTINVDSATHVVFDDIEAGQTSFRFFYDKEDSPRVIVNGATVITKNVERDYCELKCVTCDKKLGDKMFKIKSRYDDLWQKVSEKFDETRDVDKLTFIVSHPHGCSKQVSIGQWKDRYQKGDDLDKFTYTACTCPGSSGAYVFILGYAAMSWYDQHVHSGSVTSELNTSGVGVVIGLF